MIPLYRGKIVQSIHQLWYEEAAESKVKWSQLMIPRDWSCFGLSLLLEFLRLKGIQISKWWHCIGTAYHLLFKCELFKCEPSKGQEHMFQYVSMQNFLSASHLPHSEEPDVLRLWMLRQSVSFHQGQIRSAGPPKPIQRWTLNMAYHGVSIFTTYFNIIFHIFSASGRFKTIRINQASGQGLSPLCELAARLEQPMNPRRPGANGRQNRSEWRSWERSNLQRMKCHPDAFQMHPSCWNRMSCAHSDLRLIMSHRRTITEPSCNNLEMQHLHMSHAVTSWQDLSFSLRPLYGTPRTLGCWKIWKMLKGVESEGVSMVFNGVQCVSYVEHHWTSISWKKTLESPLKCSGSSHSSFWPRMQRKAWWLQPV